GREDIYGFNNLGLVYQRGMGGVTKDPKQAFEWFTKAADGGHPNAPGNLGRMYLAGEIGGKPDLAKAVAAFDEGLSRGDAYAGAYGAYVLATETVKGYGPADAAIRAGKVAALRNGEAAEQARSVLAALPQQAIDAATQQLMSDLGEPVTVDGAFGEGSQQALQRLSQRLGAEPPSADPAERLVQLARAFWKTSPFRVDLY